ncbi:1101_t:CDS:2 [Dentiscutata heterogama]|uniref:1101_t:CDS:1 n=1 Tax=Dentiscutata heterogama TaxID=1316150 RepID=A0ACA9LRE4_9GLOM|nr:1101_t:CDS:2 [Dentiscutata heterogama]
MTRGSNAGLDLSIEDKKKPSSQELKNDMTEELIQELENISIVVPVLISTEIVKNTQRLSKDDKQKEIPKRPLDERENFKKHILGSNKLDKREINKVVKDHKWKLKIETQFEFKEERRANKKNLKKTSNKESLSNTREITKNARSSSDQVVIEKLGSILEEIMKRLAKIEERQQGSGKQDNSKEASTQLWSQDQIQKKRDKNT